VACGRNDSSSVLRVFARDGTSESPSFSFELGLYVVWIEIMNRFWRVVLHCEGKKKKKQKRKKE
jgi:hypothetical protein